MARRGGGGSLTWRLLGPVELVVDGRAVDTGPGKLRCLVAALLMNPGRVTSAERLVDCLWGGNPPRGRNVLAPYATRLRRILDDAAPGHAVDVRHADGGYLIECDAGVVDLHLARTRVRQARGHNDAGSAARLLEQALAGWQPEALVGVPGDWAARQRQALARDRVDVFGLWAQHAVRLGRHDDVVATLGPLVTERPTAEVLVGPLLLALAAMGRAAEALEHYERTRDAIATELGSEPSPTLQALHVRILRSDPGLAAPISSRPVPAHLPADIVGFTGREREMAQLDHLVGARRECAPDDRDATATRICVISGTAGVGKTALAVHWAHQVRHRFPDGQFYLNLRGFDSGGSVTDPMKAISVLLDALDVPSHRIPADPDGQVALYRSLMADRRMLVMIDNARDSDQVRVLLPGAPGCLVVVTSRDQLAGLVALDGAQPMLLGLLGRGEAGALLASRLGDGVVAAHPEAVDEIITLCARLPLALALVAARVATQPGVSLDTLADQLREAHGRLDLLVGERAATTDIRAVFSYSYRQLSADAARLFRWLGLHVRPEISASGAASLTGTPLVSVRLALAELARSNLFAAQSSDRYSTHDLLHAYAAELARDDDVEETRAARRRLFDHYLHTACEASRRLDSGRDPMALPLREPDHGVVVHRDFDQHRAMAWLASEHDVLVANVGRAHDTGFHSRAWQLAWALDTYLYRRGNRHDRVHVWRTALSAGERLDDPRARAYAHRALGNAYLLVGSHAEAQQHLGHATDFYRSAGDDLGQGHTHRLLALLHERLGDHERALDHTRRALDLYRTAGNAQWQAAGLNQVGWYCGRLGRYDEALAHCRQALGLLHSLDIDDPSTEAHTWDSLGYTHHHLAQYPDAAASYTRAVDLRRSTGDRYGEATSLTGLGETHRAAGRPHAALEAWAAALAILTDLGHPDAEPLRTRMQEVSAPG